MMLGFLEGGLSSSGRAGGRHLHGLEGWHTLFFFCPPRRAGKKRETRNVSCQTPKGGLPRSIRVSPVAAERHALINAMRLELSGRCLMWRSVDQSTLCIRGAMRGARESEL